MNARLLMNVLYVWISAGHCRLYDPMLIQSAYRDSPLFFYGFNFFAEGGTQTFPFFSPEWWKSKGPAVCVVMPLSIRSELRCCWSIMKWSNTETITIESCIRKKINQNWIEKWQAKNKAALIQYVLLVSGPVWLSLFSLSAIDDELFNSCVVSCRCCCCCCWLRVLSSRCILFERWWSTNVIDPNPFPKTKKHHTVVLDDGVAHQRVCSNNNNNKKIFKKSYSDVVCMVSQLCGFHPPCVI